MIPLAPWDKPQAEPLDMATAVERYLALGFALVPAVRLLAECLV